MSTPEWMQKFKQIGHKDEDSTSGTPAAVERETIVPAAAAAAAAPPPGPADIQPLNPPSRGIGSTDGDGDEDAAALFYAAGVGGGGGSDPGSDPPSLVSANMDPSNSTGDNDEVDYDDDDEGKGTGVGGGAGVTTGAASADEEEEDESKDNSWMVDTNKFLTEEMKQEEDEVVADRNLGEEQYEDVYVDDDGNEVIVDEEGNEIQEEEIFLDEYGNELPGVEEDFFTDEALVAEVRVAGDPPASGEEPQRMLSPEPEVLHQPQPEIFLQIYDIEDQRRVLQTTQPGKRSRMSMFVPILAFLVIVSAILLVLFLVGLDDGKLRSAGGPTMAPTPMPTLPLTPTSNGNIQAAATTRFDPVVNSCDNLDSLPQPNFIDQCACNGEVTVLADDIRARREDLMVTFMPSVLPNWNETVSSCTAENQALLWLSSGINNGGEVSNLLRLQRYALAFLYVAQVGLQWRDSTGWMSERNVCGWVNVVCDSNSYVQTLNLNNNRLMGQLSEAASLLNAIEGFFAAQNDLTGNIPLSFFGSASLRSIDLSSNGLTGDIPSVSGESNPLTNINLESNSLSGPVPVGIANATGLSSFNIALNMLSGELPSELFALPLTELAIGGNVFEGTIPQELQGTTTLTSLSLGPNQFEGAIPTTLTALTSLERLSMKGIPGLTGRLPASYGLSLTNLIELTISETSVSGNIPAQFGSMTNLAILHLSSNSLARVVTPSLGLLTNLESLHLDNNALSGTIPSQLGALTAVTELLFNTNKFIGTIPSSFGRLVNLRTLTFDGNFMNGRAPAGVCALRTNGELEEFVVDCPERISDSTTVGIICSIPECCTECL